MEEKELIERIKKGDRIAMEVLVRTTQEFLFNSVFQVCHDRALAEDVVLDTYISAFKYIKNFKGESSIKTWLYRIARNTLYKHLNKIKNIDFRDDVSKLRDERALFLESDTKEMLNEALSKLDIDEREIITLVDIQGLSYEEVSEILGVPLGTVKSRLSRVRDKLRSILKEMGYF